MTSLIAREQMPRLSSLVVSYGDLMWQVLKYKTVAMTILFLGFYFIVVLMGFIPTTRHCQVAMWVDTSLGCRTCRKAWTSSLGVEGLTSLVAYKAVRERKFPGIADGEGNGIPPASSCI